jgi:organic radical activating enzyme
VLGWNVTAPLYASRGSPVTLTLGFHVYPTGGEPNLTPLRLEVTTTLDNSATQQVFYGILLQGSYSVGYDKTFTETITVPSNAMLGSSLNVSVYSDINKWFLYPTEIRDMNYDDLQSAYYNAQSQIDSLDQQISSLNQQIASLTSSNNTLSQQVTSLNSQVVDLNSQVSNLKSQSMILTIIIPLVTSSVAVIAVAVAVYMFYSKRKLARKLPQRKYAVGKDSQ